MSQASGSPNTSLLHLFLLPLAGDFIRLANFSGCLINFLIRYLIDYEYEYVILRDSNSFIIGIVISVKILYSRSPFDPRLPSPTHYLIVW